MTNIVSEIQRNHC